MQSLPQLLSAARAPSRSRDRVTPAAKPAERYRFQYLPQLDRFRGFLWLALLGWSIFATHFHPSIYQSIQLCLAVLLLAQLVVGEGRWSQEFFRHPILRYLGKISYALYLWQQPFLLARTTSWGPFLELGRTPLWLFPPVVLAILSYHCLESPALRLKKRFAYEPVRASELTGESSGCAIARPV